MSEEHIPQAGEPEYGEWSAMRATQFLRQMRPCDVPIHLWVESMYKAWEARDRDQQVIRELREALKGTLSLIRQAQEKLCEYLRPDCSDDEREYIETLLEMFDGPEQRQLEINAGAALANAVTAIPGKEN